MYACVKLKVYLTAVETDNGEIKNERRPIR